MKPHSIGRTVGIGLRVAGRIAGQRMAAPQAGTAAAAASPEANAPHTAPPGVDAAATGRAAGRIAARAAVQGTGSLARGVGGFLRPFRRVGGIVWLEVTGVFFLVFVVAFAPTLWRVRASYAHGPDHRTFLVTATVMAVFFYLSVTSFLRARRR
jgi:hypothetical protein